jgi:CheY-like chemotaxis protein
MDEATRRQVFDPFFSTKEVGKGTGLGLATVYGIVKQHDGLVNIYSELGQGTTVKVYLPASENAGEEAETAEAREVRGGSETILVAEDDESLLQLARTILERAGYTVLEARDGADAMAVVEERAGEIDLMLADVVMPKYDGRQVAERLRTLEPDARTVFMSGYSANSIHTGFVLDEGVELLQKPYSANALLVRVREVLDA